MADIEQKSLEGKKDRESSRKLARSTRPLASDGVQPSKADLRACGTQCRSSLKGFCTAAKRGEGLGREGCQRPPSSRVGGIAT